jgi:hypothetical protein
MEERRTTLMLEAILRAIWSLKARRQPSHQRGASRARPLLRGFPPLTIADASAHPASFSLIKSAPDACALICGEGILQTGFSYRTVRADGLGGITGRLLFRLREEHIAVYAIARGFGSPTDVGFNCEFSQSQSKPSLSLDNITRMSRSVFRFSCCLSGFPRTVPLQRLCRRSSTSHQNSRR